MDLFKFPSNPRAEDICSDVRPSVGRRCLVLGIQEASVWEMACLFKQELYLFSRWWCCPILYGLVDVTETSEGHHSLPGGEQRLAKALLPVLIECIHKQLLHR